MLRDDDPSPAAGEDRHEPADPRRVPWLLVVLAAVSVFAQWALRDSGHIAMHPGSIEAIVAVGDGADEPGKGTFSLATVRVEPLDNFGRLWSKVRGSPTIDLNEGGLTSLRSAAADDIETSKAHAWQAALRALGATRPGAEVIGVVASSPADVAGLRTGDVIVAVDDAPIVAYTDLADALTGGPVVLGLDDGRKIFASVGTDGRLGVVVAAAVDGQPAMRIDSGTVGGPSAGLMFTLVYLDALTGGDLTAGLQVAGTGTVDPVGNVGPVGGADLKVKAAVAAGTEVFFVPDDGTFPDLDVPEGIDVVAVTSVSDAVAALCARGAAVPELCPCSAGWCCGRSKRATEDPWGSSVSVPVGTGA